MKGYKTFFKKASRVIYILVAIPCSFTISKAMDHLQDTITIAPLQFQDYTKETGLYDLLKGIHGHSIAWGDINNDGYPDLFVGTFANHADSTYRHRGHPGYPAPNKLFINKKGKKFIEVTPSPTEIKGVSSGAAFADFDNDGYLDLISSHISYVLPDKRARNWTAVENLGRSNKLFRNKGRGNMEDVTEGSGLVFNTNSTPVAARNTFVLDYDGDGLIDLLMQDDDVWPWSVGKSRLMRNKGNMQFEDVTAAAGLPEHFYGLGGFVGDINGDTWPDIFFAHSNEMYINNGNGTFRKLETNFFDEAFKATFRDRNLIWTCGANIGDLNGDGLIDFAVGDHYVKKDMPHNIHVFINKGNDEKGDPIFENITATIGIKPALTKQPHIEIEDLNNDGQMDILVSSREAFAYLNMGNDENGIPQFSEPIGSNAPSNGLGYWPAGAVIDYDRDGRLDFMGVEWFSRETSPLLKNVTKGADDYISIGLNIASDKNRNGIGATVKIYEPWKTEDKEGLLGIKVVSISNGFSSGTVSDTHFGVPGFKNVDVVIEMPGKGSVYKLSGIPTQQHIVITDKVLRKYRQK